MNEHKPEATDTAREPSQYYTAEDVNASVGINTALHGQSALRSCPVRTSSGGYITARSEICCNLERAPLPQCMAHDEAAGVFWRSTPDRLRRADA